MPSLALGALFWWLALMVLTVFYLPGASYLLTWPLLFSLIGLGWNFYSKVPHTVSKKRLIISLVCAIPGIILVTPLVYMIFVGLGLEWSAAVMIIVVLLMGILIPHLGFITASKKWLLPGSLAVTALALIAAGSLRAGFDANHPRQDNLFYGFDANSGKAVWGSADLTPDQWTGQFLSGRASRGPMSEFFPTSARTFLQGPAPAAELPGAEAKLLEQTAKNDTRVVRLLITSPRHAPVVSVQVESDAEVQAIQVNGKRVDYSGMPGRTRGQKNWGMRYYGLPAEGIELSLEMTSAEPLKIRVVDQSYGFPEAAIASRQARPANIIPAPYPFGEATLVTKSFTF